MSDPNQEFQAPPQEFQAPPPPPLDSEPERRRPSNLLWAGVALVVVGIVVIVLGIVGVIYGGGGTGASLAFLGIVFIAFSFIPLPDVSDPTPPMSAPATVTGIFFEPSSVFRNLRVHPQWIVAVLIIGILSAAYTAAFVQRLTPERIVNFTMTKLEDSPIKPPPDRMEIAKQQAMDGAKLTSSRIGNAVRTIAFSFIGVAFVAALFLLAVLAFGGRMNYWQAISVAAYALLPWVVLQKLISFIILFIKSPDDIHPLIGQETLVTDSLAVLFKSAEHPVLWSAAGSIGILLFYYYWLLAKGLNLTGTKVSSSAGWGVAILFWVIGLLLKMSIAAIFPSFLG